MQFTQSWVSHKSPGQYHTMHTHANSVVSGVYYFEDIDENSPIVFHHTVSSNNLNTMDVPTNGPFSASLRVHKNNIVMFPSYLNHSVPINKSNKVRKSLAFNLVPVRTWGHPGSLNELNFSRLK
jgi:uncharacterized protein (TIGR02466 family)